MKTHKMSDLINLTFSLIELRLVDEQQKNLYKCDSCSLELYFILDAFK